jgi:aldehyde dehydrogenase (NAD+)
VLGITTYNFPLNLVTHKLAPALAVGAPLVLKPAPQTPMTALLLAELVAETELPGGALSVLPIPNGPELDALVRDPRLPIVSFTGSEVGWDLKAALPRKQVLLELGGNAAAVVHADAPDLDHAARSIALGSFAQAGQTCISTQRVLVHSAVAEDFKQRMLDATAALGTGDPRDEATVVGPLVSEAAAQRVALWVDEALAAGAEKLCGGVRDGNTYAPTLLSQVTDDMRVWREEIFGPVATILPYDELDDALASVNASRFGLQAGIFTADLQVALRAQRELEVGTVIVGDSPSYRADPLMPYGGWKDSGSGREGVRAAMQELTEVRSLVIDAD